VIVQSSRKWWLLTGVGIASFLACIDLTIVNTAAPSIGRDLDATVPQTQLVVNIVFVAAALSVLPAGRLCDFFGRMRVLQVGIVLSGASSLAAGCAPDVQFLAGSRFIQGVGCAVICIGSSAVVFNAFPDRYRGSAMGVLFAVNSASQAIGPILGGFLVSVSSWRWIFLGNLPLACIALAICFAGRGAAREKPSNEVLNWSSMGLFVVGLAGLILGVSLGDTFGWNTWQILGTITVGVLSLAGFLAVDRRSEHPLVPFWLFTNREFLKAVFAEFAAGTFIATTLFMLPLYLSIAHHLDDFTIGLLVLPITVTVVVLSPVAGKLVDRVGPQTVLTVGLTFFALSALSQSLIGASTGLGLVAVMAALMGVGWAFVLSPSATLAVSTVPHHQTGSAIGTTWTFHTLGGVLGLKAGMLLFQGFASARLEAGLRAQGVALAPWTTHVVATPQTGEKALSDYGGFSHSAATELMNSLFTAGYRAAMLFLAGTSLTALLTILILSRARRGRVSPRATPSPAEIT
jgi:EmrB/QacA subfamily drug resistance transporter